MVANKGTEKKTSKAQENREVKEAAQRKKSMMTWGGILLVVALVFGIMIGTSPEEVNQDDLVFGDDQITMTYFHLSTCPHCIKQNAYNKYLIAKFPNLKIEAFELSAAGTLNRYKDIASGIEGLEPDNFPGTPLTVFDSGVFNIGYGSDETTGLKLLGMIEAEQAKIEETWDASTMVRTASLRGE
jgi:hypothetical protein